MRSASRRILLCGIVILFVCILGGASLPFATVNLTVTDEQNEILLQETYRIQFPTLLAVYVKNRGDFYRYYENLPVQQNALAFLNEALDTDIADLIRQTERAPTAANIAWDGETFTTAPGETGILVDKSSLTASIFANLGKETSVILKKEEIIVGHTEQELLAATGEIGRYSTSYSTSSAERKHNIALAAAAIHLTVLAPGEQFSFNEVVGARTTERGYQKAMIIEQGKFVEGVGGGVCQVSTTLYNAALLARMEIAEARRHSLPVSYVPPSFDAMVSTRSDLKFYNATDFNLYIRATADGNRLSFILYGDRFAPAETVKLRSVTLRTLPAEYEEIPDTTGELLPEETERILTPAKSGYASEGYLDVYENGVLKSSEKIRTDMYAAQKGKKLIKKL